MRIPLTQADWPAAFTDVSRFIGRHWPAGKLKLSKAQNITAVLLGYGSSHDAKQELLSEIPNTEVSVAEYVQSMSLKALVNFGLSPITTRKLFDNLPWRVLSCWESTKEARWERHQKLQQQTPGFRIYLDEAGRYPNAKTPALLLELMDSGLIPYVEYAVNDKGLMYRRDVAEELISNLSISPEELAELSFSGSVSDFLTAFVEPMLWLPIESQITLSSRPGADNYLPPYLRRIEQGVDGYQIFHEGYQAYYATTFPNDSTLLVALKQLYLNQPIATDPDSQANLFIDGEYYVRPTPFKHYFPVTGSGWLSSQTWPPADPFGQFINPDALPASINDEHDQVEIWISTSFNALKTHSKALGAGGFEAAFNAVMCGEFITLQSLQADGDYCPASGKYDTDEAIARDAQECNDRIQEAMTIGQAVLQHHPELMTYYDAVAACDVYQHYNGNMREWFYSCDTRSLGFLAFVFGEACRKKFSATCDKWLPLSERLLGDVATGHLQPENLGSTWVNTCALLALHSVQAPPLSKMRLWAIHSNQQFLSCGGLAKVERKSYADLLIGTRVQTVLPGNEHPAALIKAIPNAEDLQALIDEVKSIRQPTTHGAYELQGFANFLYFRLSSINCGFTSKDLAAWLLINGREFGISFTATL